MTPHSTETPRENSLGDLEVARSSAGILGWAQAVIENWEDSDRVRLREFFDGSSLDFDVERSVRGLRPDADDDSRENCNITTPQATPMSKPSALLFSKELEGRDKAIQRQDEYLAAGKEVIGVCDARQVNKVLDDSWREVVRDRREAARERKAASLHIFEQPDPAASHGVEDGDPGVAPDRGRVGFGCP